MQGNRQQGSDCQAASADYISIEELVDYSCIR